MIRSSSVGRGWENSRGMPASACDAVGYVTWRDGVQQGYVTGLESSERSVSCLAMPPSLAKVVVTETFPHLTNFENAGAEIQEIHLN